MPGQAGGCTVAAGLGFSEAHSRACSVFAKISSSAPPCLRPGLAAHARRRRQTQAEARSQESVSERCASPCNLASRNCNRLTRPSLDWPAASFSLSVLQPPQENHTIGAGGEGWAPAHWRCSSCQMRRHSLAPPWLHIRRERAGVGLGWVGLHAAKRSSTDAAQPPPLPCSARLFFPRTLSSLLVARSNAPPHAPFCW